jgi:hypothetical protein
MFKTSVATRVISLAVLLAFLFGSFPTAVSAAKTNNQGLERAWAKLIDTYNHQSLIHNSAPRMVEQWLSDHRRAPATKRAELRNSLTTSNAAWGPVPYIVMRHNGFDANGKVVDKAAARQSVKDLSMALHRYIRATKNLKTIIRQLK